MKAILKIKINPFPFFFELSIKSKREEEFQYILKYSIKRND